MYKSPQLTFKAKTLLSFIFTILILSSCEKENEIINNQSVFNISLSRNSDLSTESISSVDFLLFNNQQLVSEVLNQITPNNNYYSLSFDKNEISNLVVVANNGLIDLQQSNLKDKTLNEVAQSQTTPIDFVTTFPSMFYTANIETSTINNSTIDIPLLRSLSRLDLKVVTDIDVIVDSCIISNLIDRTVLLPGSPLVPTTSQLKTTRIKERSTNLY